MLGIIILSGECEEALTVKFPAAVRPRKAPKLPASVSRADRSWKGVAAAAPRSLGPAG